MNQRDKIGAKRINPKFAWLGLFGFLGFLGIWSFQTMGVIFPFAFFGFFGFFGLYFEGKISKTSTDEDYQNDRMIAERKAYKAGVFGMLLLLVIYLAVLYRVLTDLRYVAIYYTIGISLMFAFTIIYQEYLVYHYDKDDNSE